jgi:hypothetical protein
MSQVLMSRPATHVASELTESCDRCGFPAKVAVALSVGGQLAFCGHHGNRYSAMILDVADSVVIETGFVWRGTAAE